MYLKNTAVIFKRTQKSVVLVFASTVYQKHCNHHPVPVCKRFPRLPQSPNCLIFQFRNLFEIAGSLKVHFSSLRLTITHFNDSNLSVMENKIHYVIIIDLESRHKPLPITKNQLNSHYMLFVFQPRKYPLSDLHRNQSY